MELHFLAEMTWPEVAELAQRTSVALVPTGATEAHGPHLPLETDVIIAQGSCRRAAERLAKGGIECVIAPPFYYGVTNFGMPFSGTVTIAADALQELVRGVCYSLSTHGFNRIVFSNHHLEPAHFNAIKEAAGQVDEARVAVPDVRDDRWAATLTEEFRAGARHAGSYETSLVLAERPELVKQDVMKELSPVWIDLPERIHKHGARTFKDAGSDWAYFGDPARASAEEGEMIFDALAQMLATTVRELVS
ncbi:MAG: creatininase family protein [Candidatus Promineifilaceae bacterium]|nr:creatininase family protein [Candidatus Promineifilaceae bacterium]